MKEVKYLYGKLVIEAPAVGFEERIIATALRPKHNWYKSYAAVAAAVLIVFSFSMIDNPSHVEAEKEYAQLVDDSALFDDDEVYGDLIY